MYHYVREFDPSHPNFKFLDVKNFRKQLDFFDRNYGFVEKCEWDIFTSTGKMPKKNGKVVLTFDDALICHHQFVYPELKKRGLWGLFYVPLLPYIQSKILDVHRIHLLCGAFNAQDLLRESLSKVTLDMVQDSKKNEFQNNTYQNQNNEQGVSEFKRLLNYYISYEYREHLLDQLEKYFCYKESLAKFYINRDDLLEMQSNGMVIGSHSLTHPVMSKLSKNEQKLEIFDSFKILKNLGISNELTYCHPYGGFHSFNTDTINLLYDSKVLYSFNVEPREINASDFKSSIQHLPRYDCNFFNYGQITKQPQANWSN